MSVLLWKYRKQIQVPLEIGLDFVNDQQSIAWIAMYMYLFFVEIVY